MKTKKEQFRESGRGEKWEQIRVEWKEILYNEDHDVVSGWISGEETFFAAATVARFDLELFLKNK